MSRVHPVQNFPKCIAYTYLGPTSIVKLSLGVTVLCSAGKNSENQRIANPKPWTLHLFSCTYNIWENNAGDGRGGPVAAGRSSAKCRWRHEARC